MQGGQCSFELSYISSDFSGDVLGDFVGDIEPPQVCLLFYYRDTCIVTWRVNTSNESPTESANKPFFECRDVGGTAVAAEYYLPAVVVKCVKRVEEFPLALLAVAKELDVVDYESFDVSELVLKAREVALLNGPDKTVDEFLAAQKGNGTTRAVGIQGVTYGVQQVSFSQATVAVDKQGVVGIARRLAYGYAACVCQAITRPDDEIIEVIIGMQLELSLISGDGCVNFVAVVDDKSDCNQMPGYLLSCKSEAFSGVILEELLFGLFVTADKERAAV